MSEIPSSELPLLLLAGFRSLASASQAELARRGYEDARMVHGFALRAIAAGADSASDLARSLNVSKQAATKTVAVLEERGYVVREDDPGDRRRRRLQVTKLGLDLLRAAEETFEELRSRWGEEIGVARLDRMQDCLVELVGADQPSFDVPGWIARDLSRPR